MNRLGAVGAVVLALGLGAYVAGIHASYPGRAFSVTAVMVGIGLVVLGHTTPEVAT